jgi:AAA+ ATPase superfamily predicted ATPase
LDHKGKDESQFHFLVLYGRSRVGKTTLLGAIANGARTPAEIAAVTGQSNVEVPKYLSVLNEVGVVGIEEL